MTFGLKGKSKEARGSGWVGDFGWWELFCHLDLCRASEVPFVIN